MYETEYYKRPNGEKPVVDWLQRLEADDERQHKIITAKIDSLELHGTRLLRTNMLKHIVGYGYSDLYELIGRDCRVVTYHEKERNRFVLLHAFLKKRKREKHELDTAVGFLREYLLSQ